VALGKVVQTSTCSPSSILSDTDQEWWHSWEGKHSKWHQPTGSLPARLSVCL